MIKRRAPHRSKLKQYKDNVQTPVEMEDDGEQESSSPQTHPAPERTTTQSTYIQQNSFNSLSIIRARSFPVSSTDKDKYYLEYFEDLSWFPFLVLQLLVWGFFVTFWVLLSRYSAFKAIREAFPHPSWKVPPHNISPTGLNFSRMLPWMFVYAPLSSALFILCWPQNNNMFYPGSRKKGHTMPHDLNNDPSHGHPSPERVWLLFHGMVTSVIALLIPILSYLYLTILETLYLVLGIFGLYLCFCLFWTWRHPPNRIASRLNVPV